MGHVTQCVTEMFPTALCFYNPILPINKQRSRDCKFFVLSHTANQINRSRIQVNESLHPALSKHLPGSPGEAMFTFVVSFEGCIIFLLGAGLGTCSSPSPLLVTMTCRIIRT